jgi:hypothetical protein
MIRRMRFIPGRVYVLFALALITSPLSAVAGRCTESARKLHRVQDVQLLQALRREGWNLRS